MAPQPEPSPSPGSAPPDFFGAVRQEAAAAGAATGPSPKDPPVFLGWGSAAPAQPVPGGGTGYGVLAPGKTGIGSFATGGRAGGAIGAFATVPALTGSLSQVTGQYYTWDQATRDKFLSQASLAGYDTKNMKDGQLAALWGNYVSQAASYYASGAKVTPWDIMAKDRAQREAYMKTPRTVTQKSTSYDLSTEGDARAIFYTAAQQLLGRDPTKAESRDFQKALNAMERANPTVTTTTANYLGDTLQSQESTTEGGVKEGARQMMSMDQAKAKPEYGAYQAATTYFDAMMAMIGGME